MAEEAQLEEKPGDKIEVVAETKPKADEEFAWHELDPDDIYTFPPPLTRIEAVFEQGALCWWAPWLDHAFAIRKAIDDVYLPLYKIDVPMRKILLWRKSPYHTKRPQWRR